MNSLREKTISTRNRITRLVLVLWLTRHHLGNSLVLIWRLLKLGNLLKLSLGKLLLSIHLLRRFRMS